MSESSLPASNFKNILMNQKVIQLPDISIEIKNQIEQLPVVMKKVEGGKVLEIY